MWSFTLESIASPYTGKAAVVVIVAAAFCRSVSFLFFQAEEVIGGEGGGHDDFRRPWCV